MSHFYALCQVQKGMEEQLTSMQVKVDKTEHTTSQKQPRQLEITECCEMSVFSEQH